MIPLKRERASERKERVRERIRERVGTHDGWKGKKERGELDYYFILSEIRIYIIILPLSRMS